jgi:predicted enzyme related to lactoylglutathione lyase
VPQLSLGSILIGSSNVEEMKSWYRRAFDAEENAMGALTLGAVQLFIEPHSEVSGPAREPARVILNLDVTRCGAIVDHLRSLGTRFVRPLEPMPFGLIATVADPDGNYVQVIEWGAVPEAHRSV